MAFIISIMVLATLCCIGYLYVFLLKTLFYRKEMPTVEKVIKHKPYDYWDDAGDGSGVNYVQMPDGSVRID